MAGQIDLGKVVGTDGQGVPTGGSTGQALVKKSAASYDTEWQKLNMATPESIAIVANGNTHAEIAAGQFVYVRGHANLAEGLYTASAAIPTNAALSTSNLAAVSGGGLNALIHDYPTKYEQHRVSDPPSSYSNGWTFQGFGGTTDFPAAFSLVLTFHSTFVGRICQLLIPHTGEIIIRSSDGEVWSQWRNLS